MGVRENKLADYVNKLGDNGYWIGDGVYTSSEHILAPFGVVSRFNRAYDSFEFYLSQLRMTIEQTFGGFTNKWRCLKANPLLFKLRNASRAIMAVARLHNFCSDLGETFVAAEARDDDAIAGSSNSRMQYHLGYLPSEPSDPEAMKIPGVSDLRDRIVSFIQNTTLSRPHLNWFEGQPLVSS